MFGWSPLPMSAQTSTRAKGFSPFSPAPVGLQLESIIECGFGYRPHEKYDIKITLLEVLRGNKAWELIKSASAASKPPKDNYEYILARIKFDYYARGAPGDCVHELRQEEFTAFSAGGKQYEAASSVPPKPELTGKLSSGDSLEGWLVLEVEQSESKPLLRFVASVGRAVEQGGQVWFQLY